MSHYHVKFERIGRNHDVKPLCTEASDEDALAEAIFRYAKPKLASREVEVTVDLVAGTGFITAGGFHVAGRFTVEDAGHPTEPTAEPSKAAA